MKAVLQPAEFEVPMERVVADYSILQPVAESEHEVFTCEVVAALDSTRDHDIVINSYDPNYPVIPEDID